MNTTFASGDGVQAHVPETERWQDMSPPAEFVELGAPRIPTEPVPQCPVCSHQQFKAVAVGFDYELLTCSNPWRFVACKACDHVWLNPRPAISALPVIYPPNYYAYNYETKVNPIARKGKETLDALKMRSILGHLELKPQSFLDVGCGTGRFLRFMNKQGVARSQNYGLELDAEAIKPLADEGYQAFCQRVEECERIPQGSIDLATMFHVIEHVEDPATVTKRVAAWLRPGGVFAIETPNIDSWDARLFKSSYWGGYHIPRHWNLFTADTLTRLCRDAGLEVVATKYQTGHSFWMYSFHHWARYGKKPRRGLARWFDPIGGLSFLLLFTGLDKIRAALGFRTSAVLVLARKPIVDWTG